MKKADIFDLKLELWLRLRKKGQIVWQSKAGNIPVNEMSDEHLVNAIERYEKAFGDDDYSPIDFTDFENECQNG